MTVKRLSDEFDALVQAYLIPEVYGNSNPIQCDEYEKSVFLTQAQENVLTTYYRQFETNEEIRRDLANLVRTETIDITANHKQIDKAISAYTYHISLTNPAWRITYEQVKQDSTDSECTGFYALNVVPVTQDEFYRTVNDPFKGPNKKRVLRLDIENSNIVYRGKIELVSSMDLINNYYYFVRYLIKPKDIVLATTSNQDIIQDSDLILPDNLYMNILEIAAKTAVSEKTKFNKK